ncbi:NAD(P)-dependent oxidoreductase [Sharpea azabuensis]|uniref:NAD(P)-dependent oxidoreductase n=1 Tax=Sharpea azabuensis TaxID=322505 RepID=UPI000EE9BE72|nr:NAD(P)H-binding protein [Sharpea azabuensis]HAL02113.1 NADH-flavin reductase [Lachnospiraceae bacterium]HBZ51134.1 NADH-flavin reductase [Erysipelotrichaceae bacterium]MEE3308916.1 NAD(P)H-binding protein [Sharpea azabuensis]HBZ88241.1 NADH-flavin reductase [Erysipelotrichaceae bacterium]HCJ37609.1 NADH-flavin reductase [Erysipelotrichaceae bacterium]
MKIAVVAANGRVARKVITEAIKRGHDVTAFGRHEENNTDASNYIIKDILDLTKEDLVGYDVVVDAFGTWASETMHLHTDTSQHLADLLENTNTRLLIVGGAGSLYTNKEHTETVSSGPDFPHDWLPVANAMADALNKLRKRNDVHWTYLSPAANFVADGEASGKYTFANEEFTLNRNNESSISYADYASAMLDVIESGKHDQERISVFQD